jgi:hypothetical protein
LSLAILRLEATHHGIEHVADDGLDGRKMSLTENLTPKNAKDPATDQQMIGILTL